MGGGLPLDAQRAERLHGREPHRRRGVDHEAHDVGERQASLRSGEGPHGVGAHVVVVVVERLEQARRRGRRIEVSQHRRRDPAYPRVSVGERFHRDLDRRGVGPDQPEGLGHQAGGRSRGVGAEHARSPLPQRLHQLPWVRPAHAYHGDGREHRAGETDDVEHAHRQRALADQRDHAGQHRADLRRTPVDEGARLVAPIGRQVLMTLKALDLGMASAADSPVRVSEALSLA